MNNNYLYYLSPEEKQARGIKRVLIACEFSGVVRDAFSCLGHDAWSCDIIPTELPGNHLQCDVRDVLDRSWDLMIAHPPCTHLSVSGARWFKEKKVISKLLGSNRDLQQEALDFVQLLLDAPIPRIALENPVSVISSVIRKPDQIIQPWQFGHRRNKKNLFMVEEFAAVDSYSYC